MSQVFSGDSVNNSTATTVTTTSETPAAAGNFVNPPFGNAKAMVSGVAALTAGTGTTAVTVRIRRNPNAENVIVATSGAVTLAAGNVGLLSLEAADVIPDGRPCQYQITVQQTGASGNGSISFANISTILISG